MSKLVANAESLDADPGRVIILTGPPGAGKSTVARMVAERLSPSVHLHSDDFWGFIRQGRVAPYLPAARHQNETVVDVLAAAAAGYAAGGYQVAYDGVVGPWFVDVFRSAAASRGVTLHYVVLRPDEPTTLARATARGEGALTDPGPVRTMYRQFADVGDFGAHVLDTTACSVQETVGMVLRGIQDGSWLLDA